MNINRDKHNKYVAGWTPNITTSTGSETSSGSTTSTIIYVGGGGSSSGGETTIVELDSFAYYKISDGTTTIVLAASIPKDTANITFKGDENVLITVSSDPAILKELFVSTGTNTGTYEISYLKVIVEHEVPVEPEEPDTQTEGKTETILITTWPLIIAYSSGTKLLTTDFDALKLYNITEDGETLVTTFTSTQLTIEGDTSGVSSISVDCGQISFSRIILSLADTVVLLFDVKIIEKGVVYILSKQLDKYWKLDEDGNLYTEYNAYSTKELSAYGLSTVDDPTTGALYLHKLLDVNADNPANNAILLYNSSTKTWDAVAAADLSGLATQEWVNLLIKSLVGAAPEVLDTLKELADALGNDPNFATTITTLLTELGTELDGLDTRLITVEGKITTLEESVALLLDWFSFVDGRIRANYDLWGVGEISAYGYNTSEQPTGKEYLRDLLDVNVDNATNGQILVFNGTIWVSLDIPKTGLNESELALYLTLNNYILKSYLTSTLVDYATKEWTTTLITQTKTELTNYTDTKISNLIGTAPDNLDTLGEIAELIILLQALLDWFSFIDGRIRANYDLWSVGEISAYGVGEGSSSSGKNYLHELEDVSIDPSSLTSGLLLQYNGSVWVAIDKDEVGLNETELELYLTTNNYLQQGDVTWSNLSGKPSTFNTTILLINDLHASWSSILKTEPTDYMTRWPTFAEVTDKPTTLVGYGITDAFTKDQADDRYVNITGDTMTGDLLLPNLEASGYIMIGSAVLSYDSTNKALKLATSSGGTMHFYATGEVSAYGYHETEISGALYLRDLLDVNNGKGTNPSNTGTLLMWDGSTWAYVGKDSIGLNILELQEYLETNNYVQSSDLTNYATLSWVLQLVTDFISNDEVTALLLNYATLTYVDDTFLEKTDFTANSILNLIKEVDGSGSGLDADALDGYQYNNFYLRKVDNGVTNSKAVSDLVATNNDSNAWNIATNSTLFLSNSNNAIVIYVGGIMNERVANILVGHSLKNYAESLGTLYLNRLGGNVYIGKASTGHKLSVSGGINADSYILVGEGRLKWDSANNALYIEKSDGTAINFYSKAEVSAYGFGAGSAFSQYLNDLEDVSISDQKNGLVLTYNGSIWVNADLPETGLNEQELELYLTNNNYALIEDIPTTFNWSKIINTPTTVKGYGITDVYTKTETNEGFFRKQIATIGNNSDLNDYTGFGTYLVAATGLVNANDNYGCGILSSFAVTNNRTVLLYVPDYNNSVMIRVNWSGNRWNDWHTFLTNRNYKIYTVTKTGEGASGTWGISITGDAATVGGYEATDFYRKYKVNTVTVSKALSDLSAVANNENAWNDPNNTVLFLSNNNNGLAFHIGGTLNERTANVLVGHNAAGYANFLGTLYLNRFGGNVYVGNAITGHKLSVDGGINSSSYILIGNGRIKWDSTNNALYVEKDDGTAISFYSTGEVSAYGAGSGSTISGYLNDLQDVTINGATAGLALIYNGSLWVNQTIQQGLDEEELQRYLDNKGYIPSDATTNIGTAGKLAYYSGASTIDDYTSTVGSNTKFIYLNAGIPTVSNSTIGSTNSPVYINNGTFTPVSYDLNANLLAGVTGRLAYYSGTNTVGNYSATAGSTYTPIYLNAGVPSTSSTFRVRALSGVYTGAGGVEYPSYFANYGLAVNMMSIPATYCDVIYINGYNNAGIDVPYINAIAFLKTSNTHGLVYHCRADYGDSSWGTWYVFLDSYNYDDYTVTKTGDGASGTWDISITGSASKLGTATVGSATSPIYLNQGVATAVTYDLNATLNSGTSGKLAYYSSSTAVNDYTSTIGSGTKLWYLSSGVPTNSTSTVGSNSSPVWLSNGTITECSYTFLTTTNYTSTLDSVYVNVSGDTMTGTLTVPNITVNGSITLSSGATIEDNSGNGIYMTYNGDSAKCVVLDTSSFRRGHSATSYTLGNSTYRWYNIYSQLGNFSSAVNMSTTLTVGQYIAIGNGRLYWDNTNNAFYVLKSDGTSANFYATGEVSAYGYNDGEGSTGISYLSKLLDVRLSSLSNGQALIYRDGVWKNETVNYGITMDVDWDDVKNKPAWIGSTKPSYSFSEITGTPSVTVSSSSSTNLTVNVEGASKSVTSLYATYLGGTTKAGLFTAMTYSGNTLSITIGGTKRTATIEAGGGGASSVSVTSTSSRNLSVTVDGVTDYVNDLYATTAETATRLRTARTLWGRPFDGSENVSGAMTGVDSLTFTPGTNSSNLILSGDGIRFIPAASGWGRNISFWNRENTSTIGVLCGGYGSYDTLQYLYYGGTSATSPAIAIRANKNVGIGTTNPSYLLHVAGSAYATGGFQNGSDIRYKHILRDIPLTVEDVANAPSFIFRWTDDTAPGEQAGTSAQYWQPLLPQVVMEADGRLSMQYGKAALAAVITTARTVVDHETRIKKLEKENMELKNRLEMMERRIA